MAFLATRASKEMVVQMEKASPCENPFHMNPFSSRLYVSPLASMPSIVFPSGLRNSQGGLGLYGASKRGKEVIEVELLFSKILTPSDVGRLNRLIVPRKFAEMYFPKISNTKSDGDFHILTFEDYSTGSIWHFRFNFWRTSNTYVLTKGWSSFIKEKNLNNGDMVSFYRGTSKSASTNRMFIHTNPNVGISYVPQNNTVPAFTPTFLNGECVSEGLSFGGGDIFEPTWKNLSSGSGGFMLPVTVMPQPTMFTELKSLSNSIGREQKRLRLFGVDIDIPPCDTDDNSNNECSNSVA